MKLWHFVLQLPSSLRPRGGRFCVQCIDFDFCQGGGIRWFFRSAGLSRGYFRENFHKFAVPPLSNVGMCAIMLAT